MLFATLQKGQKKIATLRYDEKTQSIETIYSKNTDYKDRKKIDKTLSSPIIISMPAPLGIHKDVLTIALAPGTIEHFYAIEPELGEFTAKYNKTLQEARNC